MATLKNTNVQSGTLRVPAGTTAQSSTPVNGAYRNNTTTGRAEFWNGTNWIEIDQSYFLNARTGVTRGRRSTIGTSTDPASSAREILRFRPDAPDGVYSINLPGVGTTNIFCLMDRRFDGGGWMMAMKATRGTTFSYGSNLWTTANTLNPTQTNRNDGDAKFETFNRFQAKDLLAIWPDVGVSNGSCGPNTGTYTWLQNNFWNGLTGDGRGPRYGSSYGSGRGGQYGGVRTTLVDFFNRVDRYFIQDAYNWSGWNQGSTIFSGQVDVRFYGFNYRSNPTADTRTRWGFGWNENGGGLFPGGNMDSDDVSSGIGMVYRGGINYSAGDYIGCCQSPSGFNRTMRVEMYVR